jgi:ketosteroid isomerase-like protein
MAMDDLYAINAAKGEFRDCFNFSDVSRLLSIADPEMVNFSDGQPCGFRREGLDALKTRLENLFERFTAKLVVIVIEIRLQGDVAYDYGWHELTLTPKDGSQPIHRRDRYVDIWRRDKEQKWKLWMYMDNQDVADPFRPEETPAVGVRVQGSF